MSLISIKNNHTLAWILLIVIALIWGSSFILIKRGLVGLTPGELGALRIATAAIFILPVIFSRIRFVKKKQILYLFSVGLLGNLIPALLFAVAQTRLESAITGVLNGLVPLFTILVSIVFLKQKQNTKVFFGVFLGLIGTFILISGGQYFIFSNINPYAFLVIAATICYAFNLILIKRHLNDLHPITIACISLMLVGFFSIIYLLGFTNLFVRVLSDAETLKSVVYISILGLFGTAIGTIIFNKVLQLTSPLFTSTVTYLLPVVAVTWGIIDGERLYFYHYLGIIFIGTGVYFANTYRRYGRKTKYQKFINHKKE